MSNILGLALVHIHGLERGTDVSISWYTCTQVINFDTQSSVTSHVFICLITNADPTVLQEHIS